MFVYFESTKKKRNLLLLSVTEEFCKVKKVNSFDAFGNKTLHSIFRYEYKDLIKAIKLLKLKRAFGIAIIEKLFSIEFPNVETYRQTSVSAFRKNCFVAAGNTICFPTSKL